jgi:flagellar motor switch protein FliG
MPAALRAVPNAPSLTGPQKAAVLIMYLDREAARALLKCMTDAEVALVGEAIAIMGDADEGTVEEVVSDFVAALKQVAVLPTSGAEFVRNILPTLVDDDRRARVTSALRRGTTNDFEAFVTARPARSIASVLSEEHPQIRAVALLRMGPENAARVLACFPPEEEAALVVRMVRAESVSAELADDVEATLRRVLATGEDQLALGGVEKTARILGRMTREHNTDVLGEVRAVEESLADDLERRMVTFEDLSRLDARGLQTLLRAVDRADLVAALKGATPAMRAQVVGALSSRAGADLLEEIEMGAGIRRTAMREAQDRVVAVARRLADEGTLDLEQER